MSDCTCRRDGRPCYSGNCHDAGFREGYREAMRQAAIECVARGLRPSSYAPVYAELSASFERIRSTVPA